MIAAEASWARVDVLVIDDFLIRPLNADQAADLLERARQRSTILTSELPNRELARRPR